MNCSELVTPMSSGGCAAERGPRVAGHEATRLAWHRSGTPTWADMHASFAAAKPVPWGPTGKLKTVHNSNAPTFS
jgi:hypothetical protein